MKTLRERLAARRAAEQNFPLLTAMQDLADDLFYAPATNDDYADAANLDFALPFDSDDVLTYREYDALRELARFNA